MAYPRQPVPEPCRCPAETPSSASSPDDPYHVVKWVRATPHNAGNLTGRAVVAGYEGNGDSMLWVIRAYYNGELLPGKLAIQNHAAYVPYGGFEHRVDHIEVCCAPEDKVRWIPNREGKVPPNAVVGGRTIDGDTLYIGRVYHNNALTPGKIHPSEGVLYISFSGKELSFLAYEVLCIN